MLPEDFDPKSYIELNDDLKHMTEFEAMSHYENQGYLENRLYKYSQIDLNYSVYIYCNGKSGSSTLTSTFLKNGYNTLHLHGINTYKSFCPQSKLNSNIFDVIENSLKNNENVYIIDSYRNPIERKLSSFFQNYDDNKSIDYITEQIDKQINFLETYEAINEVLQYFNLEPFTSFDFEKKYNLIKYKNLTIIKLRFNDINEWGSILSSIFKKDIVIYDDNLSKNKSYYNEYNTIKKTYKIPNLLLNIVANDKYFKLYNTLEEQQQYLEYWKQRTRDIELIFHNIPEDFDPKKYIELNDDLKNMTEFEAMAHYENQGYLENRLYKYS